EVDGRVAADGACVVDEDVDGADAFRNVRDQIGERVFVRQIGGDLPGGAPACPHRSDGFGGAFDAGAGTNDVGSGVGEGFGHAAPQAPARTGDEGALAS